MLAAITPPDEGILVPIYGFYGLVSVGLTAWLAIVLFRNGKTFLHDVFDERPEMGDAVNRLLVVGFFMLNLGYALLILQQPKAATTEAAVELLVNRIGLLLVSLGLIHFVNMAVFWKIRRRRQMGELPPPVPPQVVMGPSAPGPMPHRVAAPDAHSHAATPVDDGWTRTPAGGGGGGGVAGAPGPNLPAPPGGRDPWAPRRRPVV